MGRGGVARYAIWVWITAGESATAKISLSARPRGLSPVFTVCQPRGHATCTVGGLTRQAVELQAKIAVPKKVAGQRLTLRATGTSKNAISPATASNTIAIKANPSPSPTVTPTPGWTLSPGMLPPGFLPSGSIPGLPRPSGNAGSAFPQLSPFPSPSPAAAALPHPGRVRLADVSAGFPLDVRLIGGQALGMAILAAAVTIAVARLSLRRKGSKPGGGSS